MAFEDLLKNFSILNQEPWNRPPVFPSPDVAPIAKGHDPTPMVRQSVMGGMDLVEPNVKAAKSRASQNIGGALFLLPLMLAGAKNKSKGLAATFARALNQSVGRELETQNALEVWRAEQLNSRRVSAQKALLEEIKQNKGLLEKIAEKDPLLWTDEGFVNAWMTGDVTYLARSGWRPPTEQEKKNYQMREMGGRMVVFDPSVGKVVRDLGPSRTPVRSGKSGLDAELDRLDGEILRILKTQGVSGLTPLQKSRAVARKFITQKDIEGATAEEERNKLALEGLDILKKNNWDTSKLSPAHVAAMKAEKLLSGGEEEEKDLTRSDMESIRREVLGGADRFGTKTQGFANLAATPEDLEQMIRIAYGKNPAYYDIAMDYAFNDPSSKFGPKRRQQSANPSQSEQGGGSFLSRMFGREESQPPKQDPVPQPAPQPVPQPEKQPAQATPRSGEKDYVGLARKLLSGPNVQGDKDKAIEYIRRANISQADKAEMISAVEQLSRVR